MSRLQGFSLRRNQTWAWSGVVWPASSADAQGVWNTVRDVVTSLATPAPCTSMTRSIAHGAIATRSSSPPQAPARLQHVMPRSQSQPVPHWSLHTAASMAPADTCSLLPPSRSPLRYAEFNTLQANSLVKIAARVAGCRGSHLESFLPNACPDRCCLRLQSPASTLRLHVHSQRGAVATANSSSRLPNQAKLNRAGASSASDAIDAPRPSRKILPQVAPSCYFGE